MEDEQKKRAREIWEAEWEIFLTKEVFEPFWPTEVDST